MTDFLKFNIFQLLALIISYFILIIYFPIQGAIDLYLIEPWISTGGIFFLKHNWYLEVLNHQYVKQGLICIYLGYLALWIASFKINRLKVNRSKYLYIFIMIILSTSLIGILKSQSDHACPWDIIIANQYSYEWSFNQVAGHCFPGGHAATGFSLMVGFFVYRDKEPKSAVFYLLASLILGMAMGWAQMMRGAHFFSHNLWTGWYIWLLNVLLDCLRKLYLKYR